MRRLTVMAPFVVLVAACSPEPAGTTASCDTTRAEILTRGKPKYSQQNEELYIRHFFNDERDGFYVDVGAWHALESSTTAYLDKDLGWKGIAIDAQPGMLQEWKRDRPRARFFQNIVTDHSGAKETLHMRGAISSTDPNHVNRFPDLQDKATVPVDVETITLNDLLAREGVERIDFLSMDIEGGELKALSGFDIERFRPRLVCIEVMVELREGIEKYFAQHKYRRIEGYGQEWHPNWYYASE
jgi:FkbM family methyltransferase